MIGVLLAADDADGKAHLARCLALPNANAVECDQELTDHMVNGRYCQGNVRLFLDANGKRATECIPQAVVDRKLEAEAKAPLPSRALPPALSTGKKVAIGAAALLAVGFLLTR